jgi:gliding motility-associated-like protein
VVTSALGCTDTIDYVANLSVNIDYTITDSTISCIQSKLTANYVSGDAGSQFYWFFDDNTTGNGNPLAHIFSQPGNHDVSLVVESVPGCKDTFTHTLTLPVNIDYSLSDSVLDCKSAKLSATYNSGDTAAKYYWFFSDDTRDSVNPVIHTFEHSGNNNASLVILNAQGCRDTFSHYFTINYNLTPDFTYYPLIPERDSPTHFINLSPANAVKFSWDFGDGTTSALKNPVKLWNASGDYKVCLTANDTNDCGGTVCKTVHADRTKIVDVPHAFSPDGDGENDILFIRGVGIAKVSLKIYNRWGQVVFETDDMAKGWNGTFKNNAQPADVYAFILQATYLDGTTEQKQGNITLLR